MFYKSRSNKNLLIPVKVIAHKQDGTVYPTTVYKTPEQMKPIWRERKATSIDEVAFSIQQALDKEYISGEDIANLNRKQRDLLFSKMSKRGIDFSSPFRTSNFNSAVAQHLENILAEQPDFLANLTPRQSEFANKVSETQKEKLKDFIKQSEGQKIEISKTLMSCNPAVVFENHSHLNNLKDKYTVNGTIHLYSMDMGDTVGGAAKRGEDFIEIMLNSNQFSKSIARVQEISNKSWWAGGMAMPHDDDKGHLYVITHEYGHIIHDTLLADNPEMNRVRSLPLDDYLEQRDSVKENILKTYYDRILEIAKEISTDDEEKENLEYGDIDFYLSPYVRSQKEYFYSEFFADVFANSVLGKPNILGRAMTVFLKERGAMNDNS